MSNSDFQNQNSENADLNKIPLPPLPSASEMPSTGELPVVTNNSVPSVNSVENQSKSEETNQAVNNTQFDESDGNSELAGYANSPKKPDPKEQVASIKRKDLRKEHSRSVVVTFFKDFVIVLICAFILTTVLKAFVFEPFIIPSESMNNTLQVNDRIMTLKLKPKVFALKRGDVVVFKDDEGWLPASLVESEKPEDTWQNNILKHLGVMPDSGDGYLVKRLIGLPGDHVKCQGRGYPIVINDVAINNEPYIKSGVSPSDIAFDVKVPEGSIFVMGDNRSNSSDSRYNTNKPGNGFIKKDAVVGVVFLKYYPANRFASLDNESDVFNEVPNP